MYFGGLRVHARAQGAYHPSPTFAQELAQQREMRRFLKGEGNLGGEAQDSTASSPRSARHAR